MNNNDRDDGQFYTAYHLLEPLPKDVHRDFPSENSLWNLWFGGKCISTDLGRYIPHDKRE